MTIAAVALATLVGYILGSVPMGVLACRPRGKDPRQVGSGRTGGTNVYRTAGLLPAVLTVAGDLAKGYAAVAAARHLLAHDTHGAALAWAVSLAALAAVVGHNHSVFLGFRGGAGTAPNAGAALAVDPSSFALAVVAGLAVLLGTRIASLASMTVSGVLLLAIGWRIVDGSLPPPLAIYAFGQAVLVLWALRPNLARLREGTERRVSLGRPPARTHAEGP